MWQKNALYVCFQSISLHFSSLSEPLHLELQYSYYSSASVQSGRLCLCYSSFTFHIVSSWLWVFTLDYATIFLSPSYSCCQALNLFSSLLLSAIILVVDRRKPSFAPLTSRAPGLSSPEARFSPQSIQISVILFIRSPPSESRLHHGGNPIPCTVSLPLSNTMMTGSNRQKLFTLTSSLCKCQ